MKIKLLLILLFMFNTVFWAGQSHAKTDSKIHIVVTSFHELDWISHIIKGKEDRFTFKLLLDRGVDLHSYQPSIQDVVRISSADFFVHNGGVSDAWVKDILVNPRNPQLAVFNVMERLGSHVKMEVMVEGMQDGSHAGHSHEHHGKHGSQSKHKDSHDGKEYKQGEKNHTTHAKHEGHNHEGCDHEDHKHEGHDHEGHKHKGHGHEDHKHEAHKHEDHDHEKHTERYTGHKDEHVWLSLKNAVIICQMLEKDIAKLDPANKEIYARNTQAYIQQLQALDANFDASIKALPRKTLIFADRFPFLYMMQDYGIDYYAPFQGCSAETEASFKTVSFLSKKIDEHDVNYVLIIDNGQKELATTVIHASKKAKARVLSLNSLQSITQKDRESGKSYMSFMQDNLDVLKKALE